ncbi:DNA-directed RNA polymerase subunit beta [uncultured bacterium]|nr:DNA-directed RNA polymerase subunit beta [uncultured bacterium]
MHKYKNLICGDTGISYNNFFQFFNDKILETGLHKILLDMFPITDVPQKPIIEYTGYKVKVPEYDDGIYVAQCLSYVAQIKLSFLVNSKDTKEVFDLNLDYIPIMIGKNTFMINGIKKAMVYQLTKTGGIYYDQENGKVRIARLVATNGSRIEIKINQRDTINIHVNTSKKINIKDFFSLIPTDRIIRYLKHYKSDLSVELFKNIKNYGLRNILIFADIFKFKQINDKELIIYNKNPDINLNNYIISDNIISDNISKIKDNEYIININSMYHTFVYLNKKISFQGKKNIQSFSDLFLLNDQNKNKVFSDNENIEGYMLFFPKNIVTIYKSFCKSGDEIENNEDDHDINDKDLKDDEEEIDDEDDISYDLSGENSIGESFDDQYDDIDDQDSLSVFYNIDSIVRSRINKELNIEYSKEDDKFTEEDIIKFLINFESMINKPSSIIPNYDFLHYKKVKKPEAFVTNPIIRKLQKLKLNVKNFIAPRFNIDEILNQYGINNEIRKIFNSHPLVQFEDQTNSLSQISHSDRVSVFNLNNNERYQISFEGRDINPTYWNRICPVQTPEGANIGLINTLAIYARVDEYGFIVAPYYKVKDGIVDKSEIIWLKSDDDYNSKVSYYIQNFEDHEHLIAKFQDTFIKVLRYEIEYMSIDNYCMLSHAASAIPFVEHNDARRALMGANMQRQATPLNNPESPIVGTGVEHHIANMANMTICAKEDQYNIYTCASFSITSNSLDLNAKININMFDKYVKTNMKTCTNTRINSNFSKHSLIKKNTLIAEKGACQDGELALGRNYYAAFTVKQGYSFEDSIVISDKIVKYGLMDNIHMNDIEIKAKEIDLDIIERFTKDNPNTYVANLNHLDEKGIIKIGSKVYPSKIIASRVVPVDVPPVNEDSILALIFGKNLSNFRDISFKANYDISGTIIDIKYFNRSNIGKEEYPLKVKSVMLGILKESFRFILEILSDKYIEIKDNIEYYVQKLTVDDLLKSENIFNDIIKKFNINDKDAKNFIDQNLDIIKHHIEKKVILCNSNKYVGIEHNIVEYVRILVAEKRHISIGDKLSGRHGNKGVVSYVCPEVDMPFMSDGITIDLLINPNSIPNRLNLGQVLEGALGSTAMLLKSKIKFLMQIGDEDNAKDIIEKYLSYNIHRDKDIKVTDVIETSLGNKFIKLEAPAFNSISMEKIKEIWSLLGHNDDGMFRLRDGITGEYMNRMIKVAPMYQLKLNHMAKDKLSARETGGYSNILQQPLPRKSKHGGQRFGEMEGWATESYGASVFLSETLGPRSDDRKARNQMYSSIFDRTYKFDTNMSETILILVKFLNSACLMLDFIKKVPKNNN